MRQEQIHIQNKTGLHAAPASDLVALAQKFSARITIQRIDTNTAADAKSIISLLSAGFKKGTTANLIVEGDDEDEALQALITLIESFAE